MNHGKALKGVLVSTALPSLPFDKHLSLRVKVLLMTKCFRRPAATDRPVGPRRTLFLSRPGSLREPTN